MSGSLWYNPKTLFPLWWKGIGKTEQQIPGAGSYMRLVFGFTIVSSFVQPFALAVILQILFPAQVTVLEGVLTGLLVWAGFVAPTSLVNKL